MTFAKGNQMFSGRNHTAVTKQKISDARKIQVPPTLGFRHREESKNKSRLSNVGKSHPGVKGSKNVNWKGGIDARTRVAYAPRPKPLQCEICGCFGSDFKKGLCLDHDHSNNKFRGWICTRCNAALGMVKDNIEILQTMIDYLTKNRTQ